MRGFALSLLAVGVFSGGLIAQKAGPPNEKGLDQLPPPRRYGREAAETDSPSTSPSPNEAKNETLRQEIQRLTAIIRGNPCDAIAYKLRGIAWFQSGKREIAIKDFDESLRLFPLQPDAYVYRGRARSEPTQPKAKALARDPFWKIHFPPMYLGVNPGIVGIGAAPNPLPLLAQTFRTRPPTLADILDTGSVGGGIVASAMHYSYTAKSAGGAATGHKPIPEDVKTEHDKAIDDFDRAIRLDPNCAAPYFFRAGARLDKLTEDAKKAENRLAMIIKELGGAPKDDKCLPEHEADEATAQPHDWAADSKKIKEHLAEICKQLKAAEDQEKKYKGIQTKAAYELQHADDQEWALKNKELDTAKKNARITQKALKDLRGELKKPFEKATEDFDPIADSDEIAKDYDDALRYDSCAELVGKIPTEFSAQKKTAKEIGKLIASITKLLEPSAENTAGADTPKSAPSITITGTLTINCPPSKPAVQQHPADLAKKLDAAAESLGKKIDAASENVGKKIDGASENQGKKIDGAVENLGKKIDGTSENLGKKIEKATEKIGQTLVAPDGGWWHLLVALLVGAIFSAFGFLASRYVRN
jgi:tetratricopeptide (TPR) repeat protein